MSNKNCTPYIFWMPIKNNTPKKNLTLTKEVPPLTTGWFCFFYSDGVQVPKFRWLDLFSYFVLFFVWDWWFSPKFPPKETPEFFDPEGQWCTRNPGWEDCQVSKLGWKWWMFCAARLRFSLFFCIFLVVLSFHHGGFFLFFFGVLSFPTERK